MWFSPHFWSRKRSVDLQLRVRAVLGNRCCSRLKIFPLHELFAGHSSKNEKTFEPKAFIRNDLIKNILLKHKAINLLCICRRIHMISKLPCFICGVLHSLHRFANEIGVLIKIFRYVWPSKFSLKQTVLHRISRLTT